MSQVAFKGTRKDVRDVANQLADLLAGRNGQSSKLAGSFLRAIGFAALSTIKDAYVVKARGGRDEMGIQWPPLSKAYLAYGRRFGRGEQNALKRAAGLGRQHRHAPGGRKGLLTNQQLKTWRQIYARALRRLAVSMPVEEAKRIAAGHAWKVMKEEHGARTKLEVFGNRDVEILRDTGVLLNSLSPGRLTQSGYHKPSGEGGADQIFELGMASVIVGTNVAYAAAHNYGHPARPKLPRRQFLPDDESQIPESWWQDWLEVGLGALEIASRKLFASGGKAT